MKLTLFALFATFLTAGCTKTLYSHRESFTPVKRQGPWNDYYKAIKSGEEPPQPKEKK